MIEPQGFFQDENSTLIEPLRFIVSTYVLVKFG
jgi:hypothetical protein